MRQGLLAGFAMTVLMLAAAPVPAADARSVKTRLYEVRAIKGSSTFAQSFKVPNPDDPTRPPDEVSMKITMSYSLPRPKSISGFTTFHIPMTARPNPTRAWRTPFSVRGRTTMQASGKKWVGGTLATWSCSHEGTSGALGALEPLSTREILVLAPGPFSSEAGRCESSIPGAAPDEFVNGEGQLSNSGPAAVSARALRARNLVLRPKIAPLPASCDETDVRVECRQSLSSSITVRLRKSCRDGKAYRDPTGGRSGCEAVLR